MRFENSAAFARSMDQQDELAAYRQQFIFPTINGKDALYFTGNSLGLQPKAVRDAVLQELDDWGAFGVEGHFQAKHPWFSYHELFTEKAAKLVGAKPIEVVLMNGLTTNLHLMMVSFYRPFGNRYKILCEKKAFPSDQYAIESQVHFHGYDPEEAIIEVGPREGEHLIRTEDVLETIRRHGEAIALIMIGGVNYYTGQVFDMKTITAAGHEVGAKVGWDLAHAAGNIPLQLHDWGPDFACWCTYKYLNSGPGGISGVFVHERHAHDEDLPRFAGWWGYDKSSRFQMSPGFKPIPGAEGWQLSNAPVLSMAAHLASIRIFDEVGMDRLRAKSVVLTAYMEFVIAEISNSQAGGKFEVITPSDPDARGCQLSILMHGQGRPLFDKLSEAGVIADWREPNVIRLAPVPLYNSFEDIHSFGQVLSQALKDL